MRYERPAVMGIINITPDSFFAGSRVDTEREIAERVELMAAQGADMLDLGAYSSRPGAADVSVEEELARLEPALRTVRSVVGDSIPLSVDTFRSEVAMKAVGEWGADIVNDISGGSLDDAMFDTVAALHCPYVLMHMRGTPATMSSMCQYDNVTVDVIRELSVRLGILEEKGVADVIVDPGFGFAKTMEQNYRMLSELSAFGILGRPVLVGVSRKSMLTRLLGIDADGAVVATAVADVLAVQRGASIVRVHDVGAARQSLEILKAVDHV